MLAKKAAAATSWREGRGVGPETPSSAELGSAPSIEAVTGRIMSLNQLQTVNQ